MNGQEQETRPLLFQSERALDIWDKIQTGKGEVSFGEIREACKAEQISDEEGRELAITLGERLQREKEELRRLAEKDYVTGLYNRRHFEGRLSSLLDELGREERREHAVGSVGVLMGDVDNLKDVNDQYGHPVGDELLKSVARAFQNSVRDTDEVARWGGDEFAVILIDDVDEETIQKITDRIEENLSQAQIEVPGAAIIPAVSLGYSFVQRGEVKTPESVTKEAEQRIEKYERIRSKE